MKENITDIFFDLDHTLWDFDKNSVLAFDKIFKQDNLAIDTNEFIEKYVPINHSCWKLYQFDKITHEELRYQRLKQSFDAINYSISDENISKISDDYLQFLPDNNQLFEGAIEVLDYLESNYILHIITNGFAEVQSRKLKNSGITKYFKTITNSEMSGVKKPHPTIFEYALNSANVSKKNAIMIGDCIDADVRGALNFGIKAILFDEQSKNQESEIVTINSLLELKKIL